MTAAVTAEAVTKASAFEAIRWATPVAGGRARAVKSSMWAGAYVCMQGRGRRAGGAPLMAVPRRQSDDEGQQRASMACQANFAVSEENRLP